MPYRGQWDVLLRGQFRALLVGQQHWCGMRREPCDRLGLARLATAHTTRVNTSDPGQRAGKCAGLLEHFDGLRTPGHESAERMRTEGDATCPTTSTAWPTRTVTGSGFSSSSVAAHTPFFVSPNCGPSRLARAAEKVCSCLVLGGKGEEGSGTESDEHAGLHGGRQHEHQVVVFAEDNALEVEARVHDRQDSRQRRRRRQQPVRVLPPDTPCFSTLRAESALAHATIRTGKAQIRTGACPIPHVARNARQRWLTCRLRVMSPLPMCSSPYRTHHTPPCQHRSSSLRAHAPCETTRHCPPPPTQQHPPSQQLLSVSAQHVSPGSEVPAPCGRRRGCCSDPCRSRSRAA